MSEVSDIENGLGNNDFKPDNEKADDKQQYAKYDFVINNYTELEVSELKRVLPLISKKAVFGLEVGDSGTPHIQGCLFLNKKMRYRTIVKENSCFARASFRVIRNDKACIEYCQKGEAIYRHGDIPKPPKPLKIIENLYPWQQEIRDLCLTEPDDRTIHWYWEDKGNIGKSAFVKYMVVKHNALFTNGGKHNDLINLVFNNDMDNCNIIIWDLPRASKGHISYSTLESVKNGMVCNTKYETGTKCFNPPHIIVFANYPPDDEGQLSSDRWNIINLK